MSKFLQQVRRETRGQYKYLVNCDEIKNNPDSLQILDESVHSKHADVVHKIAKENSGKVVVKIGKTNEILKREYSIAKRLETTGVDGFIRMNGIVSSTSIDVIIMPYIESRSLHNFLEGGGDPKQYKNIIKKVVLNMSEAYLKTGFVHNDLHFGNVLIDRFGNPIIMDFDTSDFMDPSTSQIYFWTDLYRLFNNVNEKSYPSNKKSYIMTFANSIITILHTLMIPATQTTVNLQVQNIVSLIEFSEIVVRDADPLERFAL